MRCLVKNFQRKFEHLKCEGFEDLLQECLIHWLFTKDQYNPAGGISIRTFLDRVMTNKLFDLARSKAAKKRKAFYQYLPLEKLSEDEEIEFINKYVKDHKGLDQLNKAELPLVLTRAVAKLSPRQRKLCDLLGIDGTTIREISKYLNIPKSTVHDEMKRIREVFRKEGLEDYLK